MISFELNIYYIGNDIISLFKKIENEKNKMKGELNATGIIFNILAVMKNSWKMQKIFL
jgi:hypothetical protein